MKKITTFFLQCSGADLEMLKKCPSETSKYAGIGATIFFTGLFAGLSGGYALDTVFDNAWLAALFGMVWGLMIFNLDRYIVSSMRKEGKPAREWLMATPRIILAIIISIVIARPLELKIFEKEIAPELVAMEQKAYLEQEALARSRFTFVSDSLKAAVNTLKAEVMQKAQQRDALMRTAQEEADGTGGSRKKNLGPIYKIKKADADKAEAELSVLTTRNYERIAVLEKSIAENDRIMGDALITLERSKIDGPAARIEALSHLTAKSSAVAWAHIFIMLLFIAIETTPVFVKLIAGKGPYDNLLKVEEHQFIVLEVEEKARMNSQAKERTATFPQHERTYIATQLDNEL
ncbi:DUF4407 domain-containing protein [Chryseolinea lacunae]|uniref:DUF4407 domain-containing protein n=1 Tax=Chryseolinea lacunae TaxID=2801331 RepID=A0ABS1KKC5_9BACT|nr:DUF4407 domain-containing protein [Chryseolinea lacunae]MBL0739900.1 DUF4407 domain-containing protein [Chryseolinea lacunae]